MPCVLHVACKKPETNDALCQAFDSFLDSSCAQPLFTFQLAAYHVQRACDYCDLAEQHSRQRHDGQQ